jgi:hypothetical protein
LEAFIANVGSKLQYPKANNDNEEEDWAWMMYVEIATKCAIKV